MTDSQRLVTSAVAARAADVTPTTLRRWEAAGLISPARRTLRGHRRWDLDQLRAQIASAQGATVTNSASTPVPQPVVAAIITSDRGLLVTWRVDKVPPAGFLTGEIEPGESPEDAMIREVKEESGLRVTVGRVIGERIHPKTHRTMIYVAGEPIGSNDVFVGDTDELADIRWVTLAEADDAFAPFGGMYAPVHKYVQRRLGE